LENRGWVAGSNREGSRKVTGARKQQRTNTNFLMNRGPRKKGGDCKTPLGARTQEGNKNRPLSRVSYSFKWETERETLAKKIDGTTSQKANPPVRKKKEEAHKQGKRRKLILGYWTG